MPSLDDDQQFEAELRRFAPCEVAPLRHAQASRLHSLVAVAAVVLAALGMVLWHIHGTSGPVVVRNPDAGEITLGRAQAVLAQSPSFEEAIDRLEKASRPSNKPQTHGNQSALAALGKEEL